MKASQRVRCFKISNVSAVTLENFVLMSRISSPLTRFQSLNAAECKL
jgi:uroporphyrinogen-III synthase